MEEIRLNNYDLLPGRYVEMEYEEENELNFHGNINKLNIEYQDLIKKGKKIDELIQQNLDLLKDE